MAGPILVGMFEGTSQRAAVRGKPEVGPRAEATTTIKIRMSKEPVTWVDSGKKLKRGTEKVARGGAFIFGS